MTMTAQHAMQGAEMNDGQRWAAVATRDAGFDGLFVYSVRTTGVYCRPSCPSRTAKQANVRFQGSGADAVQQGFRACLRCRPDEPPLAVQHAALVAQACRLIETSAAERSLEFLSTLASMSPYYCHRVFKAATGVTPEAYAVAHRARRVRHGLSGGGSVTDAVCEAGFGSAGRFYGTATQSLGRTPTGFKSGGTHAVVSFALGDCSLGAILVAATDKGVCAVLLGDDPEPLVRDLQDRFHMATMIVGDSSFERVVASVIGLVERPAQAPNLPLDIRGTAFQQRVWQALRDIPLGSTASYSEIAARLGAPKSARAIAQACAANALAVLIPCHRVVRRDGGLSGYRWGVERKRTLLAREHDDAVT